MTECPYAGTIPLKRYRTYIIKPTSTNMLPHTVDTL